MPLRKSEDYIVYPTTFDAGWISGIGFGKNLWNHAKNSAYAYVKALNEGDQVKFHCELEWVSD